MFMTGSAATCRNPSMLAFTSRISNMYSSKTNKYGRVFLFNSEI
jgi:hypothetical protein